MQGVATIDDFLKAIQYTVDQHKIKDWNGHILNVSSTFHNWFYSAGYPTVNIEKETDKYVLYQTSKNGVKWHIPVFYHYENDETKSTQIVWVHPDANATLDRVDVARFDPNIQGYYKINFVL